MNQFEKQLQLGRNLVELNAEWFRKIAEFDGQNVRKFVEMNQEFAGKLPQVNDFESFIGLQREYGESLWNNTQEVFKARGELLREAVEANGESVRSLFSAQDETAVDQSAEAESVVEPVQEKEAPKAKASKKAA